MVEISKGGRGGNAADARDVVPGLPPDEALKPEAAGADDAPADALTAGVAPPAAAAAAPCPTPAIDALAKPVTTPAVVVMALTTVVIVLPTSPRTMRLAMKGISAIEREKMLAVSASRIIWLEPTKLFRTPFAPSTALMLDRFTADMST